MGNTIQNTMEKRASDRHTQHKHQRNVKCNAGHARRLRRRRERLSRRNKHSNTRRHLNIPREAVGPLDVVRLQFRRSSSSRRFGQTKIQVIRNIKYSREIFISCPVEAFFFFFFLTFPGLLRYLHLIYLHFSNFLS